MLFAVIFLALSDVYLDETWSKPPFDLENVGFQSAPSRKTFYISFKARLFADTLVSVKHFPFFLFLIIILMKGGVFLCREATHLKGFACFV